MHKTREIKTPGNWKDVAVHPLAKASTTFGVNIDLDAMTEHAKKSGYDDDEALVFFEGLLLDGRHRREVCKRIGHIPTCREYVGDDPAGYVMKKCFRQYPTVAERARMAANYASRPIGQPAKSNTSNEVLPTITDAAKAFGVSKASVERAKAELQNLCARCQRLNPPVKDCPKCAEVEKANAARGRTKRKKRQTSGQTVFSLEAFQGHISRAQSEMDKMARFYGFEKRFAGTNSQAFGTQHSGITRRIEEWTKQGDELVKEAKKCRQQMSENATR